MRKLLAILVLITGQYAQAVDKTELDEILLHEQKRILTESRLMQIKKETEIKAEIARYLAEIEKAGYKLNDEGNLVEVNGGDLSVGTATPVTKSSDDLVNEMISEKVLTTSQEVPTLISVKGKLATVMQGKQKFIVSSGEQVGQYKVVQVAADYVVFQKDKKKIQVTMEW